MHPPLSQHASGTRNLQTQKLLTSFYTMDASNASTDAKEVELAEEHAAPAETKKVRQSVDVKVTFALTSVGTVCR